MDKSYFPCDYCNYRFHTALAMYSHQWAGDCRGKEVSEEVLIGRRNIIDGLWNQFMKEMDGSEVGFGTFGYDYIKSQFRKKVESSGFYLALSEESYISGRIRSELQLVVQRR